MSNFSRVVLSGTVVADAAGSMVQIGDKQVTRIDFALIGPFGKDALAVSVYAYGKVAEDSLADVVAGNKVLIAGKPVTRKVEVDGHKRTLTEIRATAILPCTLNSEVNLVILEGRLGADPDVRYTGSGKAVANFDIAVGRPGKDAGADFFRVITWERLAETIGNNLEKGRRVLVEARLQKRSYESTDKQPIEVTEFVGNEVVFLEGKKNGAKPGGPEVPFGGQVFPEEEIPF